MIAVDDRSTDGTGAILDAIAARRRSAPGRPRRPTCPPGWLGKTHALQVGSEATKARWILFTDADVILGPGSLRKAIALRRSRQGSTTSTVGPGDPDRVGRGAALPGPVRAPVLDERPARPARRPARARPTPGSAHSTWSGAEAFRAIGGFRHLALSVDDDMRLAQALKFAGYRPRFAARPRGGLGPLAGRARWDDPRPGEELLRGARLPARRRPCSSYWRSWWPCLAPYLGLFVGPWWTRLACEPGRRLDRDDSGRRLDRHSGIGWYYASLMPLAAIAVLVSLGRSVVLTLLKGGVDLARASLPAPRVEGPRPAPRRLVREVWRSTQ